MTKADLVEKVTAQIARTAGPLISKKDCARVVDSFLDAVPLSAQTVKYEVSIPSPATNVFHVTAEFPAGGRDTLYVSLPAWSPGAYEIQNYARYVRGFGVRSATGAALFWDRYDKDTWRVATGKSERVP